MLLPGQDCLRYGQRADHGQDKAQDQLGRLGVGKENHLDDAQDHHRRRATELSPHQQAPCPVRRFVVNRVHG